MNDWLIDYFNNKKDTNSIGHAYLLTNTSFEKIEKVLNEVLNNCFFENLGFDIFNNPDICIIGPEKGVIKKEKILELEETISKTSQISENKVYIIKECETMNNYASNCLLKTLEEPQENVYSFLITDKVDLLLPTIKSRCQIINCKREESSEDENIELKEKALFLLKSIEKDGTKVISHNSKDLYKAFEKDSLKIVLSFMQRFYMDCIKNNHNIGTDEFNDRIDLINEICSKNDEKKILKKIKIIEDNLYLLKFNINGNLFIDKLVIEMGNI